MRIEALCNSVPYKLRLMRYRRCDLDLLNQKSNENLIYIVPVSRKRIRDAISVLRHEMRTNAYGPQDHNMALLPSHMSSYIAIVVV